MSETNMQLKPPPFEDPLGKLKLTLSYYFLLSLDGSSFKVHLINKYGIFILVYHATESIYENRSLHKISRCFGQFII
jgi:hypothetical protein